MCGGTDAHPDVCGTRLPRRLFRVCGTACASKLPKRAVHAIVACRQDIEEAAHG